MGPPAVPGADNAQHTMTACMSGVVILFILCSLSHWPQYLQKWPLLFQDCKICIIFVFFRKNKSLIHICEEHKVTEHEFALHT